MKYNSYHESINLLKFFLNNMNKFSVINIIEKETDYYWLKENLNLTLIQLLENIKEDDCMLGVLKRKTKNELIVKSLTYEQINLIELSQLSLEQIQNNKINLKEIYLNKNESIFEEIDDIYRTVNKEKKSEAKRIYDESYDVLLSKTAPKEKYDTLVQYKQKIKNLENG